MKNKNGCKAIYYAIIYGHCELILFLEKQGLKLEEESNIDYFTILNGTILAAITIVKTKCTERNKSGVLINLNNHMQTIAFLQSRIIASKNPESIERLKKNMMEWETRIKEEGNSDIALDCSITNQRFLLPISLPCEHIVEEDVIYTTNNCPFCRTEIDHTKCEFSQNSNDIIIKIISLIVLNEDMCKELYFSINTLRRQLEYSQKAPSQTNPPNMLYMLLKYLEKSDLSADIAYDASVILEDTLLSKKLQEKLLFWKNISKNIYTLDALTEDDTSAFAELAKNARGCAILAELYNNQKYEVKYQNTHMQIITDENDPLVGFPVIYRLLRFKEGHSLFSDIMIDNKYSIKSDVTLLKWITSNKKTHKILLALFKRDLKIKSAMKGEDLEYKDIFPVPNEILEDKEIVDNLLKTPSGSKLLINILIRKNAINEKFLFMTQEDNGLYLFCKFIEKNKWQTQLFKHLYSTNSLNKILTSKVYAVDYKDEILLHWLLDNYGEEYEDEDEYEFIEIEKENDFLIKLFESDKFSFENVKDFLISPLTTGPYCGLQPFLLLIFTSARTELLAQLCNDKKLSLKLDARVDSRITIEDTDYTTNISQLYWIIDQPYGLYFLSLIIPQMLLDNKEDTCKLFQNNYLLFVSSQPGRQFLVQLVVDKIITLDQEKLLVSSAKNIKCFDYFIRDPDSHQYILDMYEANLLDISSKFLNENILKNNGDLVDGLKYLSYLNMSEPGKLLIKKILDHEEQHKEKHMEINIIKKRDRDEHGPGEHGPKDELFKGTPLLKKHKPYGM